MKIEIKAAIDEVYRDHGHYYHEGDDEITSDSAKWAVESLAYNYALAFVSMLPEAALKTLPKVHSCFGAISLHWDQLEITFFSDKQIHYSCWSDSKDYQQKTEDFDGTVFPEHIGSMIAQIEE